jgi:hypothetical protein
MASPSPEASAIEAAYQDHIHALFQTLLKNLIDQPNSQETDPECVSRFVAGLNIGKRAKQLALTAVGGTAPARAPRTGRGRTR